jgi:hypothetical protein
MAENAFWNEVKKLFKSKQRLLEEESQSIGDAVKKEASLVEELKKLEKEYERTTTKPTVSADGKFPDKITLERVSYDAPTDSEIKSIAEAELANFVKSGAKKVDAETFDKAVKLNQKAVAAEKNKKATLAEIDELFKSLKASASVDAVKRGVGRSSIITEQLKDYDLAGANSKLDVEKQYKATVEDINLSLEELEAERENALEELNISYATKVTEKIVELKNQRDKLQNSAIEQNNKIAADEEKLNKELRREKDEYVAAEEAKIEAAEQLAKAEEIKNGYSGDKQKNYADRYNLALEFYLSLEPDVALKALSASSNMEYYLGQYYDKLYAVLERRASKSDKYL